MYRKHFGIKRAPFTIAPDPRYLYMSEQHREALAHLLYGIRSDGGFVLLTGEVGTGKTTICRRLLEKLTKKCVVAFIINPTLSVEELLAAVCDEFRIKYPPGKISVKVLVDRINSCLLDLNADRKKAILIIDEAQNLRDDVLEQIRLLTNLETNERKLLQIILIGQPELRDKLARPQMRQLSQRIVARCHLGPLSRAEVAGYVAHRLAVAGGTGNFFPNGVMGNLFAYSGGIPRLINAICDRALLGAYVQGKQGVDGAILKKAAREVLGEHLPITGYGWKAALIAATIVIFAGAGLIYHFYSELDPVKFLSSAVSGYKTSLTNVVPVPDGEVSTNNNTDNSEGSQLVAKPEEPQPAAKPEEPQLAAEPEKPEERPPLH